MDLLFLPPYMDIMSHGRSCDLFLICLISDSFYLGHYSTFRQFSLGAMPCVPTHPFMDALALVLLA